jgi:hypothetical protein
MVHAKMAIDWGRSIGWNIDNDIALGTDGLYYLRWGDKRKKLDYYIITDGAGCYPWTEYFAIFPRKTISGNRIFWKKAYKRKVWVVWGTGFHMEPETQYATTFDLLTHGDKDTFTT